MAIVAVGALLIVREAMAFRRRQGRRTGAQDVLGPEVEALRSR